MTEEINVLKGNTSILVKEDFSIFNEELDCLIFIIFVHHPLSLNIT